MFNFISDRAILGIILIVAGLFFLAQQFGFATGIFDVLLPLAFFGGGTVFLFVFVTNMRGRWWAALPGCVLLGLSLIILVDEYGLLGFLEPFTGSIFMGFLGLGFAFVYITNSDKWWALIPAGVMFTISAVAGVDEFNSSVARDFDIARIDINPGALFMLGLGSTFLLLGFLQSGRSSSLRWTFIPGIILFAMGLIIGASLENTLGYIWPIGMILAGAYFLLRKH